MSNALLVPCYNASRFLVLLREQVNHLRPAFDEVLLADDGSTDDTAAKASALGFTILRLEKNLGPGGARNALARATQAEWVHFHDVDDEIAPDYLSRVEPFATDETDVVLHWVDFIEDGTRRLVIRWSFDVAELEARPAETLLSAPMPTMSSFVRRTALLSVGGFDEELRCFEDGDMHFRLAVAGARTRGLSEVLEWSLRREGSAGANEAYCQSCRLTFLERYSQGMDPRFRPAIAEQAERTAIFLLRLGDAPRSRRAIALAESLGRGVPFTIHPALRAARAVLPAITLLRLQDLWRRWRS